MTTKKQIIAFKIAAICLFTIAALHIAIIIGGPAWYIYFGAGDKMADMATSGSWYPVWITLFVTLIFIIMGLYALSGAKIIRKLPLLRTGLFTIAAIFILRGLAVLHQTIWHFQNPASVPIRDIVFSIVALIIGILYAYGIVGRWKR